MNQEREERRESKCGEVKSLHVREMLYKTGYYSGHSRDTHMDPSV